MALPSQVSPPRSRPASRTSAVVGADVVAVPVLPATRAAGPLTLGPGPAELLDELGDDLFALLDLRRATGAAGEVVERAVLDARAVQPRPPAAAASASATATRRAAPRPAPPWPGRTKGQSTVATSLAATADDAAARAGRGPGARLLRVPLALHRPAGPPRRAGRCSPASPTPRPASRPWTGASRWPEPAGRAAPRPGAVQREDPPWLADQAAEARRAPA